MSQEQVEVAIRDAHTPTVAEPLGPASLFVEIGLVTLCLAMLTSFSGARRLSVRREVVSAAA